MWISMCIWIWAIQLTYKRAKARLTNVVTPNTLQIAVSYSSGCRIEPSIGNVRNCVQYRKAMMPKDSGNVDGDAHESGAEEERVASLDTCKAPTATTNVPPSTAMSPSALVKDRRL